MNDTSDQLRVELESAQRTVAELRAQLKAQQDGRQPTPHERENTLKEIEQAHQQWMTALDAIENPIFLHDKEFRILRANRAYQQRAGIPYQELIGRPYYEIFPKLDGPLPGCLHAMQKGEWATDEFMQGDTVYRGRSSPVFNEQGEYLLSVHSLEDVTERKYAGEQTRLFRTLIDNSSDAIEVLDPLTLRFLDINETACRDWGYSREELLSMRVAEVDPAFSDDMQEKITAQIGHSGYARFEGLRRRKDGSIFPVEISLKPIELDKPYLVNIVRDITGRKQQELAMQRANRALRTISAGVQTLIHAEDEQQMLNEMCDVAVHVGGYRTAWIGYAHDDVAKSIEQMAQAGAGQGCPDMSPLSWDESKFESCPAARAIIGGETRVVSDILSDPSAVSWRERAIRYGYASCIALPLLDGKRAFGALVLFDDKVNIFDADEVSLLEEMAGDLAFGILTLRVKKSHREHEQRLQLNMLQTVKAIAGIVEMRDPYTSGHQSRVAELARSIARRMGLSDEQIQAIHLAGLLHDLGKISIPAEILSKPGRLSEVEYSLIKMHPQSGYDILKGIDFSWPIAQMVLQHHERMDGSGYPQGLKGEQILLGARILSVADVVEAMSSHRPYRPGLGVEAALEEITRTRGTFYDGQVVDACVALFKEQNYVIPQ